MSTSHSNARAKVIMKGRSDLAMRFVLLNIFTGFSIVFGDLDTTAKQFMISFMIVVSALNYFLNQVAIMKSMQALASDQSVEEAATAHGRLWLNSADSNVGKMMVMLISIGVPLTQLYAIYM